jgi:hypothetical protein
VSYEVDGGLPVLSVLDVEAAGAPMRLYVPLSLRFTRTFACSCFEFDIFSRLVLNHFSVM